MGNWDTHIDYSRDLLPTKMSLPVLDREKEAISLNPLPFRFPARQDSGVSSSSSSHSDPLQVRFGATTDQYGNWYWISADQARIQVLSSGREEVSNYWVPTTDPAPTQRLGKFSSKEKPFAVPQHTLRGLAVTQHHHLVAGVVAPKPGILIFDLMAGTQPIFKVWPDLDLAMKEPFAPFDIAAAPDCWLWILESHSQPRYWYLNRHFEIAGIRQASDVSKNIRWDGFQPKDLPSDHPPRGVIVPAANDALLFDLAAQLGEDVPVAIEALTDGSVLILTSGTGLFDIKIYRLRGESIIHHVRLLSDDTRTLSDAYRLASDREQIDSKENLRLKPFDFAILYQSERDGVLQGLLFLVDQQGDQAYGFDLKARKTSWDLTLKTEYYPIRSFGKRGVVASANRVYYESRPTKDTTRWLPLTAYPRRRYETEAVLITEMFDGKEAACTWHRLIMDACIPPGTSVKVAARATEFPDLIEQLPWQEQPNPYLRHSGAEIPYYKSLSRDERDRTGAGSWETLFQSIEGQYMQLKLTLTSNGQRTPKLFTTRIYYPRFSYLKAYLPAVFQQDDYSASFLDRFLANVEGMFTTLEGRIAEAQHLFSTDTVPSEYTDWLLSWLGLALDEGWDDQRRRLYLKHATTLFNQRGTVDGLIRMLRLATSPCPDSSIFTEPVNNTYGFDIRIIENFRTRKITATSIGDASEDKIESSETAETSHRFSVLVPTLSNINDESLQTELNLVRRIVNREKPAHTIADVRSYFALFRVGEARLSFDTLLAAPLHVRKLVIGQSYIAEGVLAREAPAMPTDRLLRRTNRPGLPNQL